MSTKKLNSMRLLEQSKISYEVIHYPDDQRDAEIIAEIINETGRVLDLTKQKLEVAYRTKSTFHF